MKYCTHCGKEIADEAVVCTGCGCACASQSQNQAISNEDAQTGLLVLSFFIPLVGFILAALNWNTKPVAAKKYFKIAVIAIVLSVVIGAIWGGVAAAIYF